MAVVEHRDLGILRGPRISLHRDQGIAVQNTVYHLKTLR